MVNITGIGGQHHQNKNDAYKHKKNIIAIIYGGLALIFQPFIKIALQRQIWNIVEVMVGIFLILSMFLLNDKIKKPKESNLKK